MKPDDILNAIGEVDEKFVKRAHRKDWLKAFLTSVITIAIFVSILAMTMEPDYVLSRFNPDFSVNTGYVDPAHLEDDHWTSLHQTSYQNGTETASTIFSRTLFNNYTITHTTAEGSSIKLIGAIQGEYHRSEYVQREAEETLYTSSFCTKDLIGRLDSIVLHSETMFPEENQLLNMVRFEYYSNQFLVKQSKVTDTELIGYRTLDYENHRISRTKDYDSMDALLGYTEYSYDGNSCTTKSYNPDGILTLTTKAEYNWLGRIESRESYDSAGNLTSREVYHYRVWELFGSIEGLICLIGILFLAAAVGKSVYDDRIRLPIKTK